MNPIFVTMRRTIGAILNRGSSALAVAAFLSACAVQFALALENSEGARLPLCAVWAVSVAPYLPALAAFLAMDVWSEERRTGRIDSMLTIAVDEWDFTVGKFLAVWFTVISSCLLFLLISLGLSHLYIPSVLKGVSLMSFVPALFVLAMQAAVWSAASVAASSFFRHVAAAVSTALAFTVALPRGLWAILAMISSKGRMSFGEMPLDAAVVDFSCGSFSTGHIFMCLFSAVAALFVSAVFISTNRLKGRGAFKANFRASLIMILAVVASALACVTALRLDASFEISGFVQRGNFDERTRKILSESSGDVTVTCFLSRSDARFRQTGRLLRSIKRESDFIGGAQLDIKFVDPSWDIGPSARLVRDGVKEGSVVFRRAQRSVAVPLDDTFGEHSCAIAILRVTRRPQRHNVYWSVGHGELSIADYGKFGLSDIARDLAREGYRNAEIDLTRTDVPKDCALIVVAGAKDDFSRTELGRMDAFLRDGGRLLVLLHSAEEGGVITMLPQWGMRTVTASLSGVNTLSGTDVIVGDFSNHPVSEPFIGSRIILERPESFVPSAALDVKAGVDGIRFSSVASAGGKTVVAAVERGTGAGDDIAIRPTRIIAVGDSSFVVNGQLKARSSANRGFFLNCVAYLSGADTTTSAVDESTSLRVDFSRSTRRRFVRSSAIVAPVAVLCLMLLYVLSRRCRS